MGLQFSRVIHIIHLWVSRYFLQSTFFSSNAALLKTVAVMFLQTLGQKEAGNYSPVPQNKTRQAPTKAKTKQHTDQGSGCSKRDVKRVAK